MEIAGVKKSKWRYGHGHHTFVRFECKNLRACQTALVRKVENNNGG
jgi:hypothetical protein